MPLFSRQELSAKGSSVERNIYKSAGIILKESTLKFSSDTIYQIFLSHSYQDAVIILGLSQIIEEMGFSVYVDWLEDTQLDRANVTPDTAGLLRERMKNCQSLFYAVSTNSSGSVWMPWELGYFDGLKGKVAIIPIVESSIVTEYYDGREYLGLYPYVTKTNDSNGKPTLWINKSPDNYVSLTRWLKGQPFRIHK